MGWQAESSLNECCNEEFPLFSKYFTYNTHQATFSKLIEALNLGDQLKPLFYDALKTNTFTTKLVDDDSQQALSDVFSKVLNFADNSLKSENYSQIMELYGLTSSSDREKAEHLFSLSAVFTRYSSSTVFGTEHHSPLMLRYYAYALMEQAHKLYPTLMGQVTFNDWKARLLGIGDAFTCTALLSDVMIVIARERCNEVLKRIQPPAWR